MRPTSPGERRGVRVRAARAFTLLEILLVLTLIALLGAVLIGGSMSLLNDSRQKDPETALLGILQEVRELAVAENRVITLEQLPEDAGFFWGETSDAMRVLPVGVAGVRARLLTPEFAGASLLGGQIEERVLERMRFFPDGSCDPARLEVRRGESRRVSLIDPWTAAPLPVSQTAAAAAAVTGGGFSR